MKYQHIIFDVDGTLVDTEYSVLHSLSDTIRELTGEEMAPGKLTFALGITGIDVLKKLGFQDLEGAMKLWLEKLLPYKDTNQLFPGIHLLLHRLKDQGATLGVVTSRTRALFDAELPRLGITDLLDHVICSDDTKTHKPTAAPLQKYIERSGAKPEEMVYIGDSVYDKGCAENAGVDFILAGWGAAEPLKVQTGDFPQRVEDLEGFLNP